MVLVVVAFLGLRLELDVRVVVFDVAAASDGRRIEERRERSMMRKSLRGGWEIRIQHAMARDNKTKGGGGRGLGVHGQRLVFLVYLRLAVVTESLNLIRKKVGSGSAGGCGRGGRVLGDGAREGA